MVEASSHNLDSLLLDSGLSAEALRRAKDAARQSKNSLPIVISRLGLWPDSKVVAALETLSGLSAAKADDLPAAPIGDVINPAFLKSRRILPLTENEDSIEIALVDPAISDAVPGIEFATGKTVTARLIGFDDWRRAFERLYGEKVEIDGGAGRKGARWTDDQAGLKDLNTDAPAVRLVESLAAEAVDARASDIHIEKKSDGGLIRFRVDGRLHDHDRLSGDLTDRVIARLKVLSDLDVSDHRRAQDGRLTISARGHPVDVRLSIIPSAWGEGAVIRLLHRSDIALDFAALGFAGEETARIRSAIDRPQGFYLVSGPTGGGKTTTLYAALNALRSPEKKIVTVEDPIEYFFEDIHQTTIDDKAGLGFAQSLRAFLRHDPDVILVGEVRDPDTAKTAVQAALTGHLVLSTLHANDAASVPARLIEMGVEPYLIASTLTAATAQRLVRKLCAACKEPVSSASSEFKPVGCAACGGAGFTGRLVISETLEISEAVQALIRDRAPIPEFKKHIASDMRADGFAKVAQGETAREEVLRALETN